MNNISSIHTLLSEPKMFDATVKLLDEFENFKNGLFISFWDKLTKLFEQSEKLKDWKVVAESLNGLTYSKIDFINKRPKGKDFFYHIYYTPAEFIYGISYNEIRIPKKLETLYNESKRFKEYQWRMGNKSNMEMPIYKYVKSINLKDDKEFKKLLPMSVVDYVNDIYEEIMSGFTKEVQKLILDH